MKIGNINITLRVYSNTFCNVELPRCSTFRTPYPDNSCFDEAGVVVGGGGFTLEEIVVVLVFCEVGDDALFTLIFTVPVLPPYVLSSFTLNVKLSSPMNP
jgi:hypothetical protein